jgi:hypothetical protein
VSNTRQHKLLHLATQDDACSHKQNYHCHKATRQRVTVRSGRYIVLALFQRVSRRIHKTDYPFVCLSNWFQMSQYQHTMFHEERPKLWKLDSSTWQKSRPIRAALQGCYVMKSSILWGE